jgi:ectoine hydroxylase-related dioxygenase (phytanoyl-CoA dioxygenase family)
MGTADIGVRDDAIQAYFREGEARAMALGNRGPIRFNAEGRLHPEIAEAYDRCGFYVFEGVLDAGELAELEADFHDMVERLPCAPDSDLDRFGRPALSTGHDGPVTMWSKPLGDPLGGTGHAKGRHNVKMFEPEPAPGLPDKVAFNIFCPLQHSEAVLRLYGHPQLLALAAEINGEDFVPFTETIIFKKPGEGASVSWHQDGTTHWDAPDWDGYSHGFSFMAQLYGSTAANGVWYLPGSHKVGRLDPKSLVEAAGSDRLPHAVPLISKPGDVAISNRQIVHGSYANTSADWRVTINFGFHRRRSVVGVMGFDFHSGQLVLLDDERVARRSEMIGYAIDARRQHFPAEIPYEYKPLAHANFCWDAAAKAAIHGYSKRDLII